MGGGELAAGVETSILSGWSPEWLPAAASLFSLGLWSLLLCIDISLLLLSDVPLASAEVSDPLQLDTSQTWPVKLLSCRPFRAHFRQGVPVRSRALRLALMNPVLALGPSLWLAVVVVGFV